MSASHLPAVAKVAQFSTMDAVPTYIVRRARWGGWEVHCPGRCAAGPYRDADDCADYVIRYTGPERRRVIYCDHTGRGWFHEYLQGSLPSVPLYDGASRP